jgi:hypothetical protein
VLDGRVDDYTLYDTLDQARGQNSGLTTP